ncbi:HAMP domain-containing histidine kinase [Rhizobium sp. S-51]|uniref:histidine kinase n=2 Tax=Rhizobium terricola TaxID=2728849 RepID=A0A7Y0B0C7_9HYPH|nr:HAMP domain-containing histidine kinase [Rhizobium terricola]
MQVLRNMADRTRAILDRAAGRCLAPSAGGEPVDPTEVAALRRLMGGFLAPLLVAPSALSFYYGAAIALPLGFAVVVSLFMVCAVALIAAHRAARPKTEAPRAFDTTAELSPFDVCPGLILGLDPSGYVRQAGGRDRDMFLSFLREPFGRPFAEQVHVSDRIAFVQALDELRQGADAVVIDLRLDRPVLGLDQAQFMNVRMDMTATHAVDGRLLAVHAQILDIAGEMSIRDTVSLKEDEAAAAHEAKSRFLAAVSHELRTPLNAILGFSDILAGEYFGKLENDRQREYVQLIRQSGAHLLSVVNAMLDMSKIEAGRYELMLEHFMIGDAVAECEQMLSLQAANKGVKLTSRIARGLGEVCADERALRQVLINLVGNAIKFTEAGGSVIIDASREGSDLKIVVSDTGIGIAPEKMALIGRPFTQIHDDLSRNYEGSGLGLSLVKGLTALHGGTFRMESRPGEGTVVTICLPADGSGAAGDFGGGENMVEFPPRLKSAEKPATMECEKETVYDEAKAKIA